MFLKLKIKYTLIISISSFLLLFSQEELDSVIHEDILLDEVFLESSKFNIEDQRDYFFLRRRVLKVYPYIDSLRHILNEADLSMDNFKRKRHSRRYVKKFQKKIINQFSNSVTNLTRKEGVILSKLIYREFDTTVYELINKYRGGVHAFFWQRISRIYDGNLKSSYDPVHNRQDFYIEHILEHSIRE